MINIPYLQNGNLFKKDFYLVVTSFTIVKRNITYTLKFEKAESLGTETIFQFSRYDCIVLLSYG